MPELQGTEVFQEAGPDSAAVFADAGAEPQRAAWGPAQDKRRPCRVVPSAASRGRQRRSSVRPKLKSCCQTNGQLLCREKAAVALQMKGTPATLPHIRQGPAHSRCPYPGDLTLKDLQPSTQGTCREFCHLPAPCQPRRPHRLRDGSTWVPAGVRSLGLEITRLLGLASPHRREQGNPCRACLLIHHQLIHLRPEVRTPGQ